MTSPGVITRTLEPGITYFSAAEIRVVLLPIGEIPDDEFEHYASLVMEHRQVELSNVRSFYKESQKSPFKFFPWKTGNMHFRFLPEDVAAMQSPLASLHNHRRVLGVIGILSCQHTPDVARKYKEFEQRCKAFPDATTVRCLAFDPPTDAPSSAAEDAKSRPDLIIFPPGQGDHLINHMEVVMHDFAACMLGALEGWMLNASPAMASLSTLVDTPEFTGMAAAPYAAEDDSGRIKRKYARLQKAMGDYSLLAGSPLDAVDHYNTAVELGRASLDWTAAAAAMEGYAAAKLLHAAVSNDAFVTNATSVFHDDKAWRSPTKRRSIEESSAGSFAGSVKGSENGEVTSPKEGEERGESLKLEKGTSPKSPAALSGAGGTEGGGLSLTTPEGSLLPAEGGSNTPRGVQGGPYEAEGDLLDAFDGKQFWAALRRTEGLEEEVKALYEDAKIAIKKRGGLPLLVEADLRWARLLAGLHGYAARSEASEIANAVQMAAELLPLPEDRLIALTEAAAVLGTIGAGRKRVLLMWQAVELSKYFGFPDTRTLQVAREALEPVAQQAQQHPLGGEGPGAEWTAGRRPLAQEVTTIPACWGAVRAGCLEATLGLAIYAKRHADVWDAAAALLRDHTKELSTHRMQSLMENLVAAASQMQANERARPGKGPPPLLRGPKTRPPPPALAPIWMVEDPSAANATSPGSIQSPSSRQSLFLYDPFSARRQKERGEASKKAGMWPDGDSTAIHWVCGESAALDIEVANPSSVSIQIEKMVLEATFIPAAAAAAVGDSSGAIGAGPTGDAAAAAAPRPATKSVWKGKPVSLNIPAHTKPVKIQLEGTPLAPGTLILTGCRLTAFGGVSWSQSWSPQPTLNLAKQLSATTKKLSGLPVSHSRGASMSRPPPSTTATAAGGPAGVTSGTTTTSTATSTSVAATAPVGSTTTTAPGAVSTALTTMTTAGAAAPVVVTVLPPLPKLELALYSSTEIDGKSSSQQQQQSSTTIGPSTTSLRVLQGQTINASLVLTNTGTVRIDTVRVELGANTDRTTVHGTTILATTGKKVDFTVDLSPLDRAPSLDPGTSVTLPVTVSAPGTRGSAHIEEIITENIAVEYSSVHAAGGGGGGASGGSTASSYVAGSVPESRTSGVRRLIPGRKAELDVSVAVAPSLNITHIDFTEVFCTATTRTTSLSSSSEVPRRSSSSSGSALSTIRKATLLSPRAGSDTSAMKSPRGAENNKGGSKEETRGLPEADTAAAMAYEGKVLMMAEVVNRGRWALETWLGPPTEAKREDRNTGGDTPSKNKVVIGPGQRATVSYFWDIGAGSASSENEDSGQDGDEGEGHNQLNLQGRRIPSSSSVATSVSNRRQHREQREQQSPNQRSGHRSIKFEDQERQACAAMLAQKVTLHYALPREGGGGAAAQESGTGGSSTGIPLSTSGGTAHGTAGSTTSTSTSTSPFTSQTPGSPSKVPGSIPLIHGEIYNGLTLSTLSMLRPSAISVRISALPLDHTTEGGASKTTSSSSKVTTTNRTSTVAIPMNFPGVAQAGSVPYSCPALSISLGQPLKVVIEVESHVDEPTNVFFSLLCGPLGWPGAGGVATGGVGDGIGGGLSAMHGGASAPEGNFSLAGGGGPGAGGGGISSSGYALQSPRPGGGAALGTASAASAVVAAWSGLHSRLQLSVPARGKVRHVAGVALVLPGMYRIGTTPVNVSYPAEINFKECSKGGRDDHLQFEQQQGGSTGGNIASRNTLVAMQPCFVATGDASIAAEL